MKKQFIGIFALLLSLLLAPTAGLAADETFAAGSLIIPMDSWYQPEGDNGILEAYGLVYYLLAHTKDATDANGNIIYDAAGNPVQENDITVQWVIGKDKVNISDPDFTISVDAAIDADNDGNPDGLGGKVAVAKYYNHTGTTSVLGTTAAASPAPTTYKSGDSYTSVAYSGSAFVIDGSNEALAAVKEIIAWSDWNAVDVHEAQIPFTANVHRKMRGTPPRIALLDSDESGTGNADILESYLRLAGICPDVYEVLTPNEVRDGALTAPNANYDFLWAPHWAAFEKSPYNIDSDGINGIDADDIVAQVRQFISSGKALFAECASIQTFEKSTNGHFLSSNDFGHNMGTNTAGTIFYNDTTQPYSQIGDFAYTPEGGHLHNWRPFQPGDDYEAKLTPVPTGTSLYNDTVTRFTIDDGSTSPSAAPYYAGGTNESGWDYYVGGYMDGDTNNGYVVYLGGHKYASCGTSSSSSPEVGELEFKFCEDLTTSETYTLEITYSTSSSAGQTTTITFDKDSWSGQTGSPLQVTLAENDGDKEKIFLKNIGTEEITVTQFKVNWTTFSGQCLKEIKEKAPADEDVFKDAEVSSGTTISIPYGSYHITKIAAPSTAAPVTTACANNSDCTPSNVAGVRYVLNTLFNIGFSIKSREFVRSAPIIDHPYLYQGGFEYPSYLGHFRKYDITQEVAEGDDPVALWDTGGEAIPLISAAGTSNSTDRKIYTAYMNVSDTWERIDFDADNLSNSPLLTLLNVTPTNNDNSDEINVIERIRGKYYDKKQNLWIERNNKLGGIMHSAPVIVKTNSRFSRNEVAYFGDVHGMIHAIDISNGSELWAFIPPNLLSKLKVDPVPAPESEPPMGDYPAVDGSPTARDIYYKAPGETSKSWHTILVSTEGKGGAGIFALDVTNTRAPDDSGATTTNMWEFLWQVTLEDSTAPGGGMGNARRAALGKVRWPVTDNQGKVTYETKWVVFAATNYFNGNGINVYAIDLATGGILWTFTHAYSSSNNDMPGPVTLFDTDNDTFMDRIYVGDIEGKLWELATVNPDTTQTGTPFNPNDYYPIGDYKNGTQSSTSVPLFIAKTCETNGTTCYADKPIAISPAIYQDRAGEVIVIVGTGGTNWASNTDKYSVFAINATTKLDASEITSNGYTGTPVWSLMLDAGEKVWSAPTIYGDSLYLATTFGTMESLNPLDDVAKAGESTGNLYKLNLSDGGQGWKMTDIGKTRGSVFVDRDQLYLTTIDNEVIQIGDGNFTSDIGNTVLKAWQEIRF